MQTPTKQPNIMNYKESNGTTMFKIIYIIRKITIVINIDLKFF